MKKITTLVLTIIVLVGTAYSQSKNGLKVFISVDMEGITGIVNWEDVNRNGKDYDYFRVIMTKETNAAIEGALEAGATEIIVRDSHGSARNILPELLNSKASLLRDWSGGFMNMMEGIDKTFTAVLLIGYHAKAGTPDAVLDHTWSNSNIIDISLNNVSLPEAGISALLAGYYDVPVIFAAGDKALCSQVKELLGEVETVAVKEGIGSATLSLHPETARELIRKGTRDALNNVKKYKPFKPPAPYTLIVKYKNEEMVYERSSYLGIERTGDWELTYKNPELIEIMKALNWML